MLFPPRPQGKMYHTDLPRLEKSGLWLAQRKYNGIRNVIHVKNGNVNFYTRDCELHSPKNFLMTKQYKDEIMSLNIDLSKEYIFDSELMGKQIGGKKEVVLFDVLMAEGRYLFGNPTLVKRFDILKDICHNVPTIEGLSFDQITRKIYLIENFYQNFKDRFNESLNDPRLEGLVLKKLNSALDHFGDQYYETKWLIRCRKAFSATKSYNF